jgi:hypothetical protein
MLVVGDGEDLVTRNLGPPPTKIKIPQMRKVPRGGSNDRLSNYNSFIILCRWNDLLESTWTCIGCITDFS